MLKPLHPLLPQAGAAPLLDPTCCFEAPGGYPTRSQADARPRRRPGPGRSHGFALDPAKLTVNQYLISSAGHIRGSLRARTVARYIARCCEIMSDPMSAPGPSSSSPRWKWRLIYDWLAISGRRDGKPGGLAAQHILAVNRRLHRALAEAGHPAG